MSINFSEYDLLLKRFSLNRFVNFDKFWSVKTFNTNESKSIDDEFKKDSGGNVYIIGTGTVIIGSTIPPPSTNIYYNPISNKRNCDDIISSDYSTSKVEKKSDDDFVISKNYNWILHKKDGKYRLLYNPIHRKPLVNILNGDYAKKQDNTLDNELLTRQVNQIQDTIINPYCNLIKNKDPICICSINNKSDVCIRDLFEGNKYRIFESLPNEQKSILQNHCRCFNINCKGVNDNLVKNYLERNGGCSNSLQLTMCNQIVKSDTAEIGSLLQTCSSNQGSSGGGSGGSSGGSGGGGDDSTPSPTRRTSSPRDRDDDDKTKSKTLSEKWKDLSTPMKALIIGVPIVIFLIIIILLAM